MVEHIAGLLCRGEKRIEKGRERSEALASAHEKYKRTVKAERVARQGGSQASEPSLEPAAAAATDAKLDEFFQTRAPYDFGQQDRARRALLRGDVTDEEDLPEVDYCTECGSSTCWREHKACRAADRFGLMEHFDRFMVQHGMDYIGPAAGLIARETIVNALAQECSTRQLRVEDHQTAKAEKRSKRVWQRLPESEEDAKAKIKEDVGKMLAVTKEIPSIWEPAARTIAASSMNQSLQGKVLKTMIEKAVGRGR